MANSFAADRGRGDLQTIAGGASRRQRAIEMPEKSKKKLVSLLDIQ